jgi:hypothetical protein
MLKELGSRWRTMLALLIAVATALMFSTATPMTPPASSEGEAFCVPEPHDTPCISKQESGERSAPQGETHALVSPRIGALPFAALQVLVADPIHELRSPIPARSPGGIYPRGPPARA